MRTSLGERLADATVRLAEARAEFDRQVHEVVRDGPHVVYERIGSMYLCGESRPLSPDYIDSAEAGRRHAAMRDAARFLRDDAA